MQKIFLHIYRNLFLIFILDVILKLHILFLYTSMYKKKIQR